VRVRVTSFRRGKSNKKGTEEGLGSGVLLTPQRDAAFQPGLHLPVINKRVMKRHASESALSR